MKKLIPIFLFFYSTQTFGQTNFQFAEYSISYQYDSSSVCSGNSTILLLKFPQDKMFEEKINKIIVTEFNDMMGNEDEYLISLNDICSERHFSGDSSYYNWDIITTLLFNKNEIFCLKFKMTSNCGNSISDHPEYGYVTIDLNTTSLLEFNMFFHTLKVDDLGSKIKKFATKNKVDNIIYTLACDTCIHDQTKITYMDTLLEDFFITDTSIGFYLQVFDNNETDWQRRGRQEGIVGEEYMRVEIPKSIVSKFIKNNYRKRIL
ncbi:MAG: hypothetical protein ABI723_20260 [Bacteroidia bacterium]